MDDVAALIARIEQLEASNQRLEQFLGIDNQMSAQEARQLEAIKRDGIKALKYFNRVYVADNPKNKKATDGTAHK
jgi:hypothetical protein